MVQDISDQVDDDDMVFAPDSTPGFSPIGNGAEDYFSSTPRKQSAYASPRGYSGSMLTRRENARKKDRRPLGRLHTEVLLKMVLQDAQTRLVFRAQALVRADVEYYVPKEGDLDYPEKIASGEFLAGKVYPS